MVRDLTPFGLIFAIIWLGLWRLFRKGVKYIEYLKDEIEENALKPEPEAPRNLEIEAGLLSGKGIPIGYSVNGKPLHYNGEGHLVTFGRTGSGKNTTAQTPALLAYDGSALVIDPKGQLCGNTAAQRERMGHKVVALDPFDELGRRGIKGVTAASYNPLAHIDMNSDRFESDCRRVAEGLIDLQEGKHWELSAQGVTALLIKCVILFDEEKTLVRVWELLNMSDDERMAYFEIIRDRKDRRVSVGARRYLSDANEVRDSIQTAVVQLDWMNDTPIQKLLSGGDNQIRFANLKRGKESVFLIIPVDFLPTHGRFLRVLVMSALGEIYKESTIPEKRILFMLDEFAQLGKMTIMEDAANIAREHRLRFWFILQNFPQIQKLYGEKGAASILSAAGVVQGFGFTTQEMETPEYFSKSSGKKIEMKRSESDSRNSGNSPGGYSSGKSRSVNYQETEVPYLSPQDLIGMKADKQVLLCEGVNKAIEAKRKPYFEDDRYKHLAAADPYQKKSGDTWRGGERGSAAA